MGEEIKRKWLGLWEQGGERGGWGVGQGFDVSLSFEGAHFGED